MEIIPAIINSRMELDLKKILCILSFTVYK